MMSTVSTSWRRFMPNWYALTIGAILGGIFAVLAYFLLFSRAEAIAIVQTGKIGLGKEQPVASSSLLIDSLQTLPFTTRIAAAANQPSLAVDLAARQYGGRSGLLARQISDGTLFEIRVKADNGDTAIKIADIAANLAVSDDKALLDPIRSSLQSRAASLQAELAVARSATSKLESEAGTGDLSVIVSSLTASDRVRDLEQSVWDVESGLNWPNAQESKIFAPAALSRPIISSPLTAIVIGMIGGIAVAFGLSYVVRERREVA